MRIRMKINVAGTFHNLVEGVVAGDVVDIDDENAERYIKLGYAERANQGRVVEHAVKSSTEERAVVDTGPKAPRPPKVESSAMTTKDVPTPMKKTPGRPRKAS